MVRNDVVLTNRTLFDGECSMEHILTNLILSKNEYFSTALNVFMFFFTSSKEEPKVHMICFSSFGTDTFLCTWRTSPFFVTFHFKENKKQKRKSLRLLWNAQGYAQFIVIVQWSMIIILKHWSSLTQWLIKIINFTCNKGHLHAHITHKNPFTFLPRFSAGWWP